MKFASPFVILAAAFPLALTQAQVLPGTPGTAPTGQSAPTTTTSNNNYNVVPGSASDRRTDTQTGLGNIPMMDPGSENVAFNGKLWNVTNNRLMRSRFETYLTTPEAVSAEDQAYRDIMAQMIELLAPTHKPGPDPMKAFAMLPEASTYKIDGGLCNAIANSIWDVWLSQRKQANLKSANVAMDERLKQLQWNAELGNANTKAARVPSSEKGSQTKADDKAKADSATFGRTSGYIKGIAEIEARKKMNEAATGLSEVSSKVQFQALIVQMFLQRRFEHAVIACRFYPNLFKDGDSILQLDKDADLQKALSGSFGVPPTVTMIDGLALEAMRTVDESLVSFENLVTRKDIDSASNRLLEAFGVGEYLPRVRRLPMTEKTKVLDFVRKKNKLLGFLEMKDYAEAEKTVMELKGEAQDFEYAKPLAAINTAKSVSSLHISKARMAMATKDTKTLETEMKAATEIWPTNPDLANFSGELVKGSDMKSQGIMEFDRLISQRGYRQIFDNKLQLAIAVQGDASREQQLKKVLDDMARVEVVINGAKELSSTSPEAAWEKVEKEAKQFPNDPELSKLRADLGIQASEFVTAIERGRQHEEKKQTGSAIAWYLKARRMHPPSEMAQTAIKRLVSAVRAGDQPPAESAPTSALDSK
jgi:tetratricopeptide (TPR) repeat protein